MDAMLDECRAALAEARAWIDGEGQAVESAERELMAAATLRSIERSPGNNTG